eukprot:gnl/Chilomastix_caulleri/4608.p1 GENE.gnl/Chilomastix_caulleri/4608~~gnl/Chilomastix_caulleri/4608.p1  ORF type:complete len:81 (+),score=22.36 gnl/Chilomastix_caulleri/4608:62-304(+)
MCVGTDTDCIPMDEKMRHSSPKQSSKGWGQGAHGTTATTTTGMGTETEIGPDGGGTSYFDIMMNYVILKESKRVQARRRE